MKKLSKIAQVTFFAAAFAVLFSGTADAYIDPVSYTHLTLPTNSRV